MHRHQANRGLAATWSGAKRSGRNSSGRSQSLRWRCSSKGTISTLDPELYCEVRKHYGFVWFEMQHSTMTWDNVAKMIAACPGPDGATPMIRMPDQLEFTPGQLAAQ